MRDILDGRVGLVEQLGWSGERGVVPDGLPRRLLTNHEAELAEHQRLLADDRLALDAGSRRLAGLFPKPPEPAPPHPKPRRRRVYSPISDMLAERPRARPH